MGIPQNKVFISLSLLTLFVSLSSRAHTDCPYLFLKNFLPHCFGEVAVLRQRDGIIDIFFGVSTFFLFFFSTTSSFLLSLHSFPLSAFLLQLTAGFDKNRHSQFKALQRFKPEFLHHTFSIFRMSQHTGKKSFCSCRSCQIFFFLQLG